MRIALIVSAWLLILGAGYWALVSHELTPGPEGSPPGTWPAHVQRPLRGPHPVLLVFAHPQCPCTRATLAELASLMTQCRDQVAAQVVFLKPDGVPGRWEQSELWQAASAIPGVQVVADQGGRLAEAFSVTTSGTALLYDVQGRLMFHGGITMSRGHQGDNAGRTALTSLLSQGRGSCRTTPVFGCSLCAPAAHSNSILAADKRPGAQTHD